LLLLSDPSISASVFVFLASTLEPIAHFNLYAILPTGLSTQSSHKCLACISASMGHGHRFASFILFVGVSSTMRERAGPNGPNTVGTCIAIALPFRSTAKGATRPKLN
jgi:hypothetical protein